jgi:PAS domain S-box-containing protein
VGKTKQQLIDELSSLRRELSDLKQAASEPLLDAIVDIAADAIISIDEDQCITRFNQGAEQIFGYRAQEMIGESVEILLPEQFRGGHPKHVQAYASGQSSSRLMNERADVAGRRKDGTTFPARASISRIEQHGKITLTVILRDVGAIRRAEEEVRRTRDELAHVNRIGILGEISASLAHELNQPLTAILTNAQVLRREVQASPMRVQEVDEIITDVVHDARRAAEVIKRLRALLKPGERQVEALDLNKVVAEARDLLHSEMVIRQASVALELAPDLPEVSGDRVQLQQVLINLLGNALDAMDATDPADRRLLIRTRQAGPAAVEVCVEDSGVGFEGEPTERIFEPFFTTKEHGMGMGLAISKTLLQAHGGDLRAERVNGQGAAFYFTLPLVDAGEAADTTAAARSDYAHQDDRSDVSTVFVVDDDPSVRQAMQRLIGSAGYAVEAFDSAQAFLQREPYEGIGCLIVDLHMPGETGLDLQATLNTRAYTMPMIFITGGGDTASGVRTMKQGAVDYLAKPVDDEELLRAVAQAVEIDTQARIQYTQHTGALEKIARLTAREGEIMSLVVKGLRNKQIADALKISEKTVKVHRGHVMQKMEVRSVADLVRLSEVAADDS